MRNDTVCDTAVGGPTRQHKPKCAPVRPKMKSSKVQFRRETETNTSNRNVVESARTNDLKHVDPFIVLKGILKNIRVRIKEDVGCSIK